MNKPRCLTERPRVLFICGSMNQTTQMHQIAKEMPDCDAFFSPFYGTGVIEVLRRFNLIEMSIAGNRMVRRCFEYLASHQLATDYRGQNGPYDLVLTCTDQVVPSNILDQPLVLVQEGMCDPVNLIGRINRIFPVFARWMAGTASTGQSLLYDRFCVASEGYRSFFASQGIPEGKMVVTGIPNFDNCVQYKENGFPYRGYVLVCTSDARETFKFDNRRRFIERAVKLAAGRQLIFKLHPNETERARSEIQQWAPEALVFQTGSAEEMVANADVVLCQWSSLAHVALALGKEVHSYFDLDELRKLVPVQNGCAAQNIAAVCKDILASRARYVFDRSSREGAANSVLPPSRSAFGGRS
jgi:hypothetical protein